MKNLSSIWALLLLCSCAVFGADKIDFDKDVFPILKNHCIACHTHSQAKGELRVDTVELMLKGGETGPAIVKGDAEKSLLYRIVAGKEETIMPPKKNKVGAAPLSKEQVQKLKLWIDQGAAGSSAPVVLNNEPIKWRPLPAGLNPIHSVAVSPDGVYGACGRANQIFVYNLASGLLAGRLADPALLKGNATAAADHDLILALAFSPDGMQLASGGYRSIRLWRRSPPSHVVTLDSGAAESACAAVSPDGKWIATAGSGNSIKLWNAAGETLAKELSGHTGPVRALQFSADNAKLCSGSADKSLRIWTLFDGQSVQVDAVAEVNAVSWAAGDKRVAAGCADKIIRIWALPADGAAWEKPKELKSHTGPVTALSTVWPSGKQILSGSADGSIRLWEAESGNEARKLDHGAPVTAVAVSSDGKRFASSGGNAARLWRDNGENIATFKGDRQVQDALAEAERNVAFAKDQLAYFKTTVQENEKALATETESNKKAIEKEASAVKEAAAKQEAAKKAADAKAEIEKTATAPLAEIKQAAEARTAAEKVFAEKSKLAKTANDKVAQSKTALTKATDAKTAADKAVAALTPKSKPNEAKDAKSRADAAKTAFEQATAALAAAEKAAIDVNAAFKTAEEAKAAADKSYAEISEKHKDIDAKFKAAEKASNEATQALQQAEQAKSAAEQNQERLAGVQKKGEETLAATKASLAAAEADQKTADAALEAAKKALAESEKPIRAIAFSKDGRLLATSGDDRIIHTWSTENLRGGEQYRGLESVATALSFLPDGRLLSAAGAKTQVWNSSAEWKLERTLGTGGVDSPILDRVLALTYSHDGKWLASGGGVPVRAGELKIWNPADGSLIRDFKEPHTDTVFGISFSRNNQYLASGAADKLIKVFETASGKQVRIFEGHTQHVLSVHWKRNGRTLVSSGADRVAKLWDWITGEQLKTVEGFKKEVTAACYLESQNEILLASGDGQLRTAKENGDKIRAFQFGKEYIESAAATRDGKLVIAGGSDSVLRIFDTSKEKVLSSFEAPKDESAGIETVAKPAK